MCDRTCGEYCVSNVGELAEEEVWHMECAWCTSEATFGCGCYEDGVGLGYE